MSKKKNDASTFSGFEQIFGSKTRFGLLKLFYNEPEKDFFMRELARILDNQLNAIRREVANLSKMGIVKEVDGDDPKKKFYRLNTDFTLHTELSALITKSELLAEKSLVELLSVTGGIDLCIFTGTLLGTDAPCDILIVGRVNKNELSKLIKQYEKESNKNIDYAVFTPEEYKQRKSLTDKFLFGVLESKKMVVIDKFNEITDY
ncbi:MAG: hypothetical protein WC459_02795 [Patescibacteria group bacterium]